MNAGQGIEWWEETAENVEEKIREFDAEFEASDHFGLKLSSGKKEPCPGNLGRAVEVISGGQSYLGFYRGLTEEEDEIILFPQAALETYPSSVRQSGGNNGHNGNNSHPGNNDVTRVLRWTDRPAHIARQNASVLPVNERYLFWRVEQAEREFGNQRLTFVGSITISENGRSKCKAYKAAG